MNMQAHRPTLIRHGAVWSNIRMRRMLGLDTWLAQGAAAVPGLSQLVSPTGVTTHNQLTRVCRQIAARRGDDKLVCHTISHIRRRSSLAQLPLADSDGGADSELDVEGVEA